MNNIEEYLNLVNSSFDEKKELSNGVFILSVFAAFLLGVVLGTSSAENRVAKILGKANGKKNKCCGKHKKCKKNKRKDDCISF